jgi:hypothetical protein
LPQFKGKTDELRRGQPLQLEDGDLKAIADAVGRSPGHVHRVIGGERESEPLRMRIEAVVGWPMKLIRLPRHESAAA